MDCCRQTFDVFIDHTFLTKTQKMIIDTDKFDYLWYFLLRIIINKCLLALVFLLQIVLIFVGKKLLCCRFMHYNLFLRFEKQVVKYKFKTENFCL